MRRALSAHCRILTAVSSSQAEIAGSKMDDSENCEGSLDVNSRDGGGATYIPNATPMLCSFWARWYMASDSSKLSLGADGGSLGEAIASSRSRIHSDSC